MSGTITNDTAPAVLRHVERRSIDVVPDNERHGSPINQFTLWFGANMRTSSDTRRQTYNGAAPTAYPSDTRRQTHNPSLLADL